MPGWGSQGGKEAIGMELSSMVPCPGVPCPYKSNQAVIDYLGATGFTVVHDVALALKPLEFATVTPQEWAELARKHDRADADGIFLSCTNTTQIEAIADIEQALGKPVVNSNQAVL